MKNSTLFLGACVLLTYFNLIEGAPEATCKDFVASLMKRQLGGISACSKTMKFKNPKEKASKMNCILRCVMIKEGLLDTDGNFLGADEFQEMITEMIPTNLIDKAAPKFRKCRELADGSLETEKDEFCKSYDPLIKCMLDVIGTLCKEP